MEVDARFNWTAVKAEAGEACAGAVSEATSYAATLDQRS